MGTIRLIAAVAVLAVLLAACSADPTTSEQYLDLERELAAAGVELAALDQQLAGVTAERDALAMRLTGSDGTGEAIAEMVMTAWATGDSTDVDAIYAEDVRMALDGDTLAGDREEIGRLIDGARGFGNTYLQVGPVVEYVDSDGDVYIATLVEVSGPGHPTGDPIVGFYRAREGEVIRHVFLSAQDY